MAAAKKKVVNPLMHTGHTEYEAIRECYWGERMWQTREKAVREKDYLLVTSLDAEVPKVNFAILGEAPVKDAKPLVEEPVALSQMTPRDAFLT